MDDVALARALHVVGGVWWIGGVAMVTTVLLPAVRRFKAPGERLAFFDAVERRFAGQARIATLVVGLTGLHMLARLDLWDRFADASYWWMHAMVALWAIFSLMLFVLEPLFLHRWFAERARRAPETAFALAARLHAVLLALSLVTIAGAVAGAHGWLPV
jgi:uncharacterized membrane protein